MKKKFFFASLLSILLASALSSGSLGTTPFLKTEATNSIGKVPQNTQKQKFDYMSSILSRNTKPLGLKENVTLRKWLNQPSIKWAMRTGGRHILN
jgi:hypothetical protein